MKARAAFVGGALWALVTVSLLGAGIYGGSGGGASGAAGGDLSGTYPNPTVAKVAGTTPSAYGLSLLDDANAGAARTTLGLGTSATVNTGTSGATIPLLNAANTFSAQQTFSSGTSVLSAIPYEMYNGSTSNIQLDIRPNIGWFSTADSCVVWNSQNSGTFSIFGSGTNATGVCRYAEGVVSISDRSSASMKLDSAVHTVGGLATCDASHANMRSAVTDAAACAFATTPTGGGSVWCPVVCNGSAWIGG